jgi:hypothetical protein
VMGPPVDASGASGGPASGVEESRSVHKKGADGNRRVGSIVLVDDG